MYDVCRQANNVALGMRVLVAVFISMLVQYFTSRLISQNQSQKKWRNSIDYYIVRAKIWEHSSTISFENSQHNVQEDSCIGESPSIKAG